VLPREFDLKLSSAAYTTTDSEGRFSLPAKSMSGTLLTAHPEGYAEADLTQSGHFPAIRLKPWGKLAGILHIGNSAAANKPILLQNDYDYEVGPAPILLARTATTDAEGHFVIEGVPPGDWRLEPHHLAIHVRAGETTQVYLGGNGAKLLGKLVSKKTNGTNRMAQLTVGLNTRGFSIPAPRRDDLSTLQEYLSAKNEWLNKEFAFKNSAAGQKTRRDLRAYTAILQPDGSFSIDEVLPGTYQLSIGGDPLYYDPIELSLLGDATMVVQVSNSDPGTSPVIDVGIVEINCDKR
jgi:hypothetical protein